MTGGVLRTPLPVEFSGSESKAGFGGVFFFGRKHVRVSPKTTRILDLGSFIV